MVRLKDPARHGRSKSTTSFNSTMVRLKAALSSNLSSTKAKFQFHNGSIKSANACPLCAFIMTGFNSTMVRLKVAKANSKQCLTQGFNSTMVRLKANMTLTGVITHCTFQFHNGSIKSRIICDLHSYYMQVSIPQWFD